MEEYKLELKQIVDYPRYRMYRQFVRGLIEDTNIRIGRESRLYYYTVLSCFANFRTSPHCVKGVTYTVYPGEWICTFEEMMKWFRVRTKRQVISIMEKLQEKRAQFIGSQSFHVIPPKMMCRGVAGRPFF